jgi:fatty-acyl-CoA synthase
VLDNIKRSIGMHRVRYAGTGAAPIAPDLIKWYRALGIDMRELYGQTENCGLATGMPDQIKLGTVGVPAPRTELRLSLEGEILLRGPHVFMGYYNRPDATAETLRGGWLHTGDVGTVDADGYLKIVDRIKDVVKTGGEWVSSLDIEDLILRVPGVAETAVVGAPDEKWGERPVALVVLKPDKVASTTEEAIRRHVAEFAGKGTISKYAVPDRVHFVDAIPKTSVGKLDKKVIRAKLGELSARHAALAR